METTVLAMLASVTERERWFVDITETHTSLPAQPRRRALIERNRSRIRRHNRSRA